MNEPAPVDPRIIVHEPPLQPEQEWANALTHGIGAVGSLLLGAYLVMMARDQGIGMMIACTAYSASVMGTFLFSTLSHIVRRQPLLNTMRSWDQAMIYAMISGTYTPLAYAYASDTVRAPLLAALWIAAGAGFLGKVALRHRVNSIGTISYLALGWLPAIPLVGQVPSQVAWAMLAGGVLYTIGVVFLINDHKVKYLHAGWHVSVMTAAAVHFWGILKYVVAS